jgi:hypothetical protein
MPIQVLVVQVTEVQLWDIELVEVEVAVRVQLTVTCIYGRSCSGRRTRSRSHKNN